MAAVAARGLVRGPAAQSARERLSSACKRFGTRIKAVEQKLARQTTERQDDNAARSARSETEIAAAARKLEAARRPAHGRRGAAVARRPHRAVRAVGSRPNARSSPAGVRAAYVGGREDLLKLLLSQDSPGTLGRMLVYLRLLRPCALRASASIARRDGRPRGTTRRERRGAGAELVDARKRPRRSRSRRSSTPATSGARCSRSSTRGSATRAARSRSSRPRNGGSATS